MNGKVGEKNYDQGSVEEFLLSFPPPPHLSKTIPGGNSAKYKTLKTNLLKLMEIINKFLEEETANGPFEIIS